jgi:hypothetical protein
MSLAVLMTLTMKTALLGCDVVQSDRMLSIFQWNTLPSSLGQQYESSAPQTETEIPSKTLFMNYQHTWNHTPEDSNLQTEI